MGWLWGNSNGSPDSQQQKHRAPPSDIPQSSASPPSSDPQLSPPKRQPTRDEIAEADLRSFLESLEADVKPSSTRYNHVPQPRPFHSSPSPSQSSSQSAPPADQPRLMLSDELLPTTMRCRDAFDSAFYCQSLGGQFNNLYRYGGIRNCSENWSDFWFCMKAKSNKGDKEKERMVRDHYKKKMEKYRVGPSSEDIWKGREEKLQPGEAFSVHFD